MTFNELERKLSDLPKNRYIFDLLDIDHDQELVDIFKKFIKFGNYPNQLVLDRPEFHKLSDNMLRLQGRIEVSFWTNTHFNIQFLFIRGERIEYVVGIQPGPKDKWINEVGQEIRRIYDLIPIRIIPEEAVYLYSSISKGRIPLEIYSYPDPKPFQADIDKGVSLLIQIESELLSLIQLEDSFFHISHIDFDNLTISKKVNYSIHLIDKLFIQLLYIKIISSRILELDALLTLKFPGGQIALAPKFVITKNTFSAKIPIDQNTLPIDQILPKLNIGNLGASIEGSFNTNIPPVYGFFGDFSFDKTFIKQDLTFVKDFTYTSLNDYAFYVKFRPDTNGYVPVFLEAFMKEVSLSQIINVVANINLDIPSYLEPIRFFQTYIYYCEPGLETTLLDGTLATPGTAVSSGIHFLGLKGYGSFEATEAGVSGSFQLEKLRLDGIIEIGGNGTGSPDNWTGQGFEAGGLALAFEMDKQKTMIQGGLNVKILDLIEAEVEASYDSDQGLYFEFAWSFGSLAFDLTSHIERIDKFGVSGKVDVPVIAVDLDLKPIGRLQLDLDVLVTMDLKVRGIYPSTYFDCSFKVNGNTYSLARIALDLAYLDDLEDTIKAMVLEKLKALFADALAWLLGVLNDIINLAADGLEKLKLIGEALKDYFDKGLQQATQLLQEATYVLEDIVNILHESYTKSVTELIQALAQVGYELTEIGKALYSELQTAVEDFAKALKALNVLPEKLMDALRQAYGLAAEKAGLLMKQLQYGINAISKSLEQVYGMGHKAVAKVLDAIGYGASDIANVLKDVWNVGRDSIRNILEGLGHAGSTVGDVLDDLFGSIPSPSCLTGSDDLIYMSLKALESERGYKLRLLEHYRDSYLSTTEEGQSFLEKYQAFSEIAIRTDNNQKQQEYLTLTYHEFIIPVVRNIEKLGFKEATKQIDFFSKQG